MCFLQDVAYSVVFGITGDQRYNLSLLLIKHMRTAIQAKNIKHTAAIDTYLDKRLSEIDRVLGEKETTGLARVELAKTTKHHKNGKIFYAEITFHVRKKDFRAAAYGEDLYEAIDLMQSEIMREIKKHHERSRTRKEEGGREAKKRLRGQR